ncbi:VanZ family protein [Brachybacterium halotolerans subsp. kimchii]|uniref:VanZ family protein n=1 Tax=Brachybacterium halotolerans TaxID=2795215 RepID=UPI001E56E949|nr:VanZ family protein [Brachybacterium halotolerans]UEJ82705.1 VanZ family protein [Brachybacterium halotolerans subsp. kimchii]
MTPRLRVLVAGIALLANIGFYLPSVPDTGPAGPVRIDTVYHVGVFALTVWAFGRLLAPARRFPIGWVALAAAAHAVLIEVLQGALLPHRSADPGDVLADLVGIAIGVLAWTAEPRIRRRASRESAADPGQPRADAACTRPADR